MIKSLLLPVFLTGLMGLQRAVAAAHAQPDNISVPAGQLTPAGMQADFDLMRHALEEAHPGLYRYSTKAQIDRGFDAQRAKLSGPMTRARFEAVVAETLALIRCGHTKMNPDEEMEATIKSARTLPLRVVFEGRRMMVVLNETPDDRTIRPGMELLEINGHKADLAADFRRWRHRDGQATRCFRQVCPGLLVVDRADR